MMPLFSRARSGKYTNPLLQFDLAKFSHNGDYGVGRRLFCTCFRDICGSANTGDINPQQCLVTPVETELGCKEKEGEKVMKK